MAVNDDDHNDGCFKNSSDKEHFMEISIFDEKHSLQNIAQFIKKDIFGEHSST